MHASFIYGRQKMFYYVYLSSSNTKLDDRD